LQSADDTETTIGLKHLKFLNNCYILPVMTAIKQRNKRLAAPVCCVLRE